MGGEGVIHGGHWVSWLGGLCQPLSSLCLHLPVCTTAATCLPCTPAAHLDKLAHGRSESNVWHSVGRCSLQVSDVLTTGVALRPGWARVLGRTGSGKAGDGD